MVVLHPMRQSGGKNCRGLVSGLLDFLFCFCHLKVLIDIGFDTHRSGYEMTSISGDHL